MSSSASSTIPEKAWVSSGMNVDRVKCKWTLKTSQLLSKETGEAIYSPLFYTSNGKERWRLKLYPRGEDELFENSVSLFLHLEASERLGIHAELKIEVMMSQNMIVERSSAYTFNKLGGRGWSHLMEQSKLLDRDYSGITINFKIDTVRCKKQKVSFDSDSRRLNENLCLLFENPKFSDITIIVGNERFRAHKSILSVRSSVFAAMFDHEEMDDNRKNEVKIEDMEPVTVKGMLQYIYTGRVTDLEGLARGLLGAAEKYDLEGLKAVCEESLCQNLDKNNAAGILVLANLYRASELKESAMKFIKDNLRDVIKTDGYQEIKDPEILKEIISFHLDD